jgi:hypothetical protein
VFNYNGYRILTFNPLINVSHKNKEYSLITLTHDQMIFGEVYWIREIKWKRIPEGFVKGYGEWKLCEKAIHTFNKEFVFIRVFGESSTLHCNTAILPGHKPRDDVTGCYEIIGPVLKPTEDHLAL